MTKHTRIRAAGWIAAGALATTAFLAPATVAAATPSHATLTAQGCTSSLFHWDVANGQNAYAMVTVNVHAVGSIPENCTFSFSLNSYTAQGATWPTSGTQALLDHQSITLSAANSSGQLSVAKPACYGQTDFYTGTTKFDGIDGALPHYPNVVTPTGLISYSNGGSACQEPSSSPSQPVASESVPPSASPSESPSTPPSEPPSASPSQDPSQPVQSESIPPSASPSPSDSTPPSASPSDSPSASPSTSPSASPSESASASPSASASQPVSSPSGSVLAETGTPQITPPPTDAVSGGSSSTGSGWQLVLLAVAGMIGSLIALKPAKARRR